MRGCAFLPFSHYFSFFPTSARSQTFGGIGIRAEGMGGAFVAVADDASAVYWNPAGIATGATFDFQVSGGLTPVPIPGSDSNASRLFVGAALPVLGLSFYRTHTVQASPDRQNGGSGRVQIRPLTTSNVGVTVVQTLVPKVVIGTTARLVRGGIEGFESRTTGDFDAGAMVSAGNIRLGITGRNLREPEFEGPEGPAVMRRQVRAGVALAPRSLPSGVHGPFSLAFDADLTKTPAASGRYRGWRRSAGSFGSRRAASVRGRACVGTPWTLPNARFPAERQSDCRVPYSWRVK